MSLDDNFDQGNFTPKPEHMMPGLAIEARLLPIPDDAVLDERERAAKDYVIRRSERKFNSVPLVRDSGQKHQLGPLFTALLQSPRIAEVWSLFGDVFQTAERRGSFSNRDRELADPVLSFVLGTPIAPSHVADAVGTGIAPVAIKAILDGRFTDLSPDDRQLAEYICATVNGELTPAMFDALVSRMGLKTAVEYTSYITYKIGLLRSVQAFLTVQGLTPETYSSIAHELLQAYIEGRSGVAHDYDRGDSWVEERKDSAS